MTEKLLFQFENSKGELLSIWYCEKIAESTAFSKFQKLYLEIIDSGFAGSIHWDVITSKLDRIETVYTTMPDGETIQLIAFEHNRQLNEGFITFAGMDPAHRKHAFEKSRLLQFRFFKNIFIPLPGEGMVFRFWGHTQFLGHNREKMEYKICQLI